MLDLNNNEDLNHYKIIKEMYKYLPNNIEIKLSEEFDKAEKRDRIIDDLLK